LLGETPPPVEKREGALPASELHAVRITNPNGARKERKFYQVLLIALNAEGPDIRLRRIAEQLVKAAEKGEPWAIRELMDRIDGKVPQATILQGDAEEPVRYVEVPRKAANTEEWIASQAPALASAASDKLN
jgi:hypothetical protein